MAADPRLERLVKRPEIRYRAAMLRLAAWAVAGASVGMAAQWSIHRLAPGDESDAAARGSYLPGIALGLLAVMILRSGHAMIFGIRLYQRYADAETRLRCQQTPTCSEYAILAIDRYGAAVGTWKALGRLRRCRPPGRVDFP